MKIYHIVAMSKNRVIGKDNKLPFKIPGDLARFQDLTLNHTVMMGRKTWESIPEKHRPLFERHNIVLTRSDKRLKGVDFDQCPSIEEGLTLAKEHGCNELYIIGGAEIYEQTLGLVHEIRMTIWKEDVEGDTYYPDLKQHEWYEIYSEDKGTHLYKDFVRTYDGW
jgi:dihydrofolate reductase